MDDFVASERECSCWCCCWLMPLPPSPPLLLLRGSLSVQFSRRERGQTSELLSLFDFFFYVSRYSRVRRVVVVVFASFQLCLSDKISFFFNIASFISYFNSLLAVGWLACWLCVNHGAAFRPVVCVCVAYSDSACRRRRRRRRWLALMVTLRGAQLNLQFNF